MSSPRQQPGVALQQVDCDEVGGSPAWQRLEAPVLALAVNFPAPWIGVLGRVLELDKGAGRLARAFQREVGAEDAGVIELENYLKPRRHRMQPQAVVEQPLELRRERGLADVGIASRAWRIRAAYGTGATVDIGPS